MKKQRIAIAKQHVHWIPEQWKKVTVSDEINFQVFRMVPPSFDTHHHLINLIPGSKFQLLNTRIRSWFGKLFLVKLVGLRLAFTSCPKKRKIAKRKQKVL